MPLKALFLVFTAFITNLKKTMCVIHALLALRGCQLSKSNACIIFTCIKKNGNFSKETRYS